MPDYHFKLLSRDQRVLGDVKVYCPDDAAGERAARTYLTICNAVDMLRGALLIKRVTYEPDTTMQAPPAGPR